MLCAALLAHFAFGAPVASLRLVAEIGDTTLPITDLRAGKFLAQDGEGWRTVPLDAPVRVEGSLEQNARFVFWTPSYHLVRAATRGSRPANERPWFSYVVSPDHHLEGEPKFEQIWSEKIREPLVAVFAWVLEGKIVQCVARRLPSVDAMYEHKVGQLFALSEREAAGFGVVLLWSKGRFVAAAPTYKDPAAEAAFHEIVLNKTAGLDAALAKGDDSVVGRERDSLLRRAVAVGATESVTVLLRHGARATQQKQLSLLAVAAFDGRSAIVDQLVTAIPSLTEPPSFLYLARWGHEEIARRLLAAAPASVTISDEAVEEALTQGFTDLARDLLKRVKLDPTRSRERAHILVKQVQLGFVAAAELFLEQQADPNVSVNGYTPLGEAVRLGETALVEPLLRAGANPNTADATGNTPLLYACQAGDLAVAERLLKQGADPRFRRGDGQTPLHFAAAQPGSDLVKLLIAAGADPTASGPHPNPLEIALMTGAAQTATALAQAGARVELEWTHHKHAIAAAFWLDVDTVVADVLARGWKPEGALEGPWDAATIARISGATRTLALLSAQAPAAPAIAPTVVPIAELDSPLTLLKQPVVEDRRDGRARNANKTVVVLGGIVNEDGRLLCPRIMRSSDGRLSFAALQSSPNWRYAPPRKNGAPVCVPVTVLVSFVPMPRDVYDLGEVDTAPVVLASLWPTVSTQSYFNRGRVPKATAESNSEQNLEVQFAVAKNGGTHSGIITNRGPIPDPIYLLRAIADSTLVPATRSGAPVDAYFHFVREK